MLDDYLNYIQEAPIATFIERNWKKLVIAKGAQVAAFSVILHLYRQNDLEYVKCKNECSFEKKFFKKRSCNKKCLETYKTNKEKIKEKEDKIKLVKSMGKLEKEIRP